MLLSDGQSHYELRVIIIFKILSWLTLAKTSKDTPKQPLHVYNKYN